MTNSPTDAIPGQVSRYYFIDRGRPCRSEDVCSWEDWRDQTVACQLTIHELGFPVFLSANEVAQFDEYVKGDPYGVQGEAGEPTAFHKRRIDCTIGLLGRALANRKRPARILDIACGEGHITAEIQKAFPAASISALDCSLTAIRQAKMTYGGIDFIVANAYLPPYAEAEFDVVVLNNIWEHVPDPMRLLTAATRVLKQDGAVIISTPSRYRLGNLLRVLRGQSVKLISKHHVTEYTVGQVIEQLKFAGYAPEVADFPVPLQTTTFFSYLIRKTVAPVLRRYCKLVGSHHSLEWTVFYFARRRAD